MANGMPHARERGKEPKQLDHLRVKRGINGGHIVEHHFAPEPYQTEHKPEIHPFGKEEGDKMLAHVAKHAGVEGYESGEAAHEETAEAAENAEV